MSTAACTCSPYTCWSALGHGLARPAAQEMEAGFFLEGSGRKLSVLKR